MSVAALLFSLIVENVTLVDGTGRPPREGVTIVIDGDRAALEIPANGVTEP